MTLLAQLAALLAILAAGIVYGTDTFCAVVQRPALTRVDDATLTAMMGNVHRYADRRLPAPGIVSILAATAACAIAATAGHPAQSTTAGIAALLLVSWVVLYLRISAPINRTLTAAADAHNTPENARELQRRWDSIIVLRAAVQALAVAALGASLIT